MTRLRSSSFGLRPSGYDPTRHRGKQMTDVSETLNETSSKYAPQSEKIAVENRSHKR